MSSISTTSFAQSNSPAVERKGAMARVKKWAGLALHHLKKHAGIGIVCAVAYFDPGNWSVDLQAGSQFGYALLFIVLLSGVMAVVFQCMASRLGVVTGLDLATHCRMLLYNRPNHTKAYRWCCLYPLYVLSEVAIISTDLAELLGSATAFVILFPSLPLWAGVLLTASDVFLILAFSDPTRGRPARLFEGIIAILVLSVFVSLIYVIVRVGPKWGDAFDGFIPSKNIFKPGGLYTSVGIIGATVMPHGLFLGSSLATQDRIDFKGTQAAQKLSAGSETTLPLPTSGSLRRKTTSFSASSSPKSIVTSFVTMFQGKSKDDLPDCSQGHAGWENRPLAFVKAHLWHGIVDVAVSLLGFAVVINALILITASAEFYDGTGSTVPADLFQANDLLQQRVGKVAAIMFALALLCAGESAGITVTLAGQIVSEGFIRWTVSPVLRRAITRLIGLLPALLVAVTIGRSGMNALLVASQVILSFVLPFVAFPLVYITSSKKIMSVRKDRNEDNNGKTIADKSSASSINTTESGEEFVDFSNGKITMVVGYLIWLLVVITNGYVLVALALGED